MICDYRRFPVPRSKNRSAFSIVFSQVIHNAAATRKHNKPRTFIITLSLKNDKQFFVGFMAGSLLFSPQECQFSS
jgi:hypothetical protein